MATILREEQMEILLPNHIKTIIERIESAGHEAYAVGGCVRDSILDLIPHDWDVCTSALPEEVKHIFIQDRVVETGIKYGTVTVIIGEEKAEVTTFRTESSYSDRRRPELVGFVGDVEEDLSRRDFTINAIAYNKKRGLVDPFGGEDDIKRGLIRCVGDPKERFGEDALRIMRALRFASVYGYRLDGAAAREIRSQRHTLMEIAAERIGEELVKILCGNYCEQVLLDFPEVLTTVIPEIGPMVGFKQYNPHHEFDVWTHTVKSIAMVPPNRLLKLTMLFHDIGKPVSFTRDKKGVGHFYGHANVSERIAGEVLRRLKVDRKTIDTVLELVKHHGTPIESTDRSIKKWLNRLGEEKLRLLMHVRRADRLAKRAQLSDSHRAEIEEIDMCEEKIDDVISSGNCFALKDLAIDGKDLLELGFKPGPHMGKTLDHLLSKVMDGDLPNDRNLLMQHIESSNLLFKIGEE